MSETPSPFPDVMTLLERGTGRARGGLGWYALGGFALVVLLSSYVSQSTPRGPALVRLFSAFAMLLLVGGMMALSFAAVRKHREEQSQLEAVEELVQLRRWSQAAVVLSGLLSGPTRSPHTRVKGLIYLATVLARYHRFADAIAVQEYLLEHVAMDDGTTYGLRLGRAMAQLHDDRLHDADRSISELRRNEQAAESAGLALVEIYRDVITGHPDDAAARFEAKLPLLRAQLGHRCGDAYALAARAYDALGRPAEAKAAYTSATLLVPSVELNRRYPEVAPLADKYGEVASCELRVAS